MLRLAIGFVIITIQIWSCWSLVDDRPQTCSSNHQCVNLLTADGQSNLCAYNDIPCIDLIACQSNHNCSSSDMVCVKHSCHEYPVCYPRKWANEKICPPMECK